MFRHLLSSSASGWRRQKRIDRRLEFRIWLCADEFLRQLDRSVWLNNADQKRWGSGDADSPCVGNVFLDVCHVAAAVEALLKQRCAESQRLGMLRKIGGSDVLLVGEQPVVHF